MTFEELVKLAKENKIIRAKAEGMEIEFLPEALMEPVPLEIPGERRVVQTDYLGNPTEAVPDDVLYYSTGRK